jgi:nicotinamide-nucleotide amidase
LTGYLSGYEFPVTRSVPSYLTSGKIGAPEDLPALVIEAGLRIATAESMTGGLLASSFAEMSGASRFFVGGIVAYSADVKFDALGVTPGPVVSQRAAAEMAVASRAWRVISADRYTH